MLRTTVKGHGDRAVLASRYHPEDPARLEISARQTGWRWSSDIIGGRTKPVLGRTLA